MTRRRVALVAVTAALATTLGVAGLAAAAGVQTTASCTPSPDVTPSGDYQQITVTCTVPNPPPVTVTATATATATATQTVTVAPSPTPTATASQTPTSTPTPTATATSTTTAPGDGSPYSAGAYFYSSPGPVDQAKTTAMRTFLATFPDQKGTPYPILTGVGGNKWGMVHAIGQASDPVWTLTGSVPAAVAQQLAVKGFHAPAWLGDVLTGTSDSPFVVDDQADGITIWAAKAVKGSGNTINVGGAGYFVHGTNGLDKRRPESDSTVNLVSRGRIPDTMVVTKAQVDAAIAAHTDLGHVLEIFWPETDSTAGYLLPMVGAEGSKTGWGAEGQRIAIDPTVDLAARNCTPQALVLALTLQRHGAYIGDNAGGGAVIKLEQDSTAHPVWGSTVGQDELKGCVSWSDFVATTH